MKFTKNRLLSLLLVLAMMLALVPTVFADGGEGSGSGSSGESLSSVAAASLHRTVASYLRQGKLAEAKALLASYKDRMTPMQKRQFTLMLQGYDETASL